MDKATLLTHLTHFHQQVLAEMYAVTCVRAPPAEIQVRPLLHADASWGKGKKGREGIIYIDEAIDHDTRLYSPDYPPKSVAQKEVELVHETGHHCHAQNEQVWEEMLLHPALGDPFERKTFLEKRLHRYDELVAEFFTCCYYERKGLFATFLAGRSSPFYSPIHTLYQATPSDLGERDHICRWLITHAYTEVRRQFRESETLQRIGRFVRNE